MDESIDLIGACSCGRNHYFIQVLSNTQENVQVLYDDRAEHGIQFTTSTDHYTDI